MMSLQHHIQNEMKRLSEGKRWEYMVLYSSEGLPLASFGTISFYTQDELLEFSFQLINLLPLLSDKTDIQKITIEVEKGKMLIFIFFNGLEDNLTLAAVVSRSIPYKQNINKMIRFLRELTPASMND